MKKLLIFFQIIFYIPFLTHSQIITTIAGNGVLGISGDGGPATAAELFEPQGIGFDNSGNMYISVSGQIRQVNSSGIINPIAGINTNNYSGDGGPATSAELNKPTGVCTDKKGNIYIADGSNLRIRIVNTSGIINTFAGNGIYGYSGDGGPATAAEMKEPSGVACDTSGNLYIADEGANTIRKVNTLNTISTFAGNGQSGFTGDGGPATIAELSSPYDAVLDLSGNIYIADAGNNRVRMVDTSGIITTIAGNGVRGFSGDGGSATSAELNGPAGIAIDAIGNLFISDWGNWRIRLVNSSSIISTLAGNGTRGYNGDNIPATNAEFNDAWDVKTDKSGNIYIADALNDRIRFIPTLITTLSPSLNPNGEQVTIFPNPTTGIFTISLVGAQNPDSYRDEPTTIEIYNVLGEKVNFGMPKQVQHDYELDISSQPNGVYFYRVVSETGSLFGEGKIVKD